MRFLVFLISISYTLAATPAGEFMRLPALLKHFQLHQQTNADASFIDFLWQHYGTHADSHHHSHDAHNQLPFKLFGQQNIWGAQGPGPACTQHGLKPALLLVEVHHALPSDEPLYAIVRKGIFQPPRASIHF